MTEEEKKQKAIDKAQAKTKQEDLISKGLCIKCGKYIKPDERDMNTFDELIYCPDC